MLGGVPWLRVQGLVLNSSLGLGIMRLGFRVRSALHVWLKSPLSR